MGADRRRRRSRARTSTAQQAPVRRRGQTGPHHYLLCSGWATPFGRFADRAAALGWTVGELDADHEVVVTAPELLAGALSGIAHP
jgi:hypothetical protein